MTLRVKSAALATQRWCPDCAAELQSVVEGGKSLLRCPWTFAGKRSEAVAPVWGCSRPYKRSGGS